MLSEALEYPRARDDWFKSILIGGVLSLFSWLLVPAILVVGCIVRVLRSTMAGEETPSVFDDWGDLLRDGLRATIIGLAYGLIPASSSRRWRCSAACWQAETAASSRGWVG